MEKLDAEEAPPKKRSKIENLVRIATREPDVSDGRPIITPCAGTEVVSINSDLHDRIRAFLPQLEAANSQIGKTDLNLEDVDEDAYIEMVPDFEPWLMKNLALGVLEEKPGDSDEDTDGIPSDNEGNILDKLMRRDRGSGRRDLISSVDPPSTNRASFPNSSVDSDASESNHSGDSSEADSNIEESKDGDSEKDAPDPFTETSHSIRRPRHGDAPTKAQREAKKAVK